MYYEEQEKMKIKLIDFGISMLLQDSNQFEDLDHGRMTFQNAWQVIR